MSIGIQLVVISDWTQVKQSGNRLPLGSNWQSIRIGNTGLVGVVPRQCRRPWLSSRVAISFHLELTGIQITLGPLAGWG